MACVKLAAACGMFLLLGLPLPAHAATDFATWLQGVRTEAVGLGLDEGDSGQGAGRFEADTKGYRA